MNILCPIDFSNTSVNACKWAAEFLEQGGGGKLELLYCVNTVSRSSMFIRMDDVFVEQAENDFEKLLPTIKEIAPNSEIVAKVVVRDPKTFISGYANHHSFDFIVNGTKGLTALKDMTVGSVTAYLMDRSKVPLLTIPEATAFRPVKKIMMGVDSKPTEGGAFQVVTDLVRKLNSELIFVNVNEDIDATEKVETFPIELEGVDAKGYVIPNYLSIPHSLTDFSIDQEVDILAVVHRKQRWYQRIFKNSVTKEKLFEIKTPLLILPMNNE